MQSDYDVGDRVRLKPDHTWKQPYNRWAQRGRLGTVEHVFTPLGSKMKQYRVRFDRSRPSTRSEVFSHGHLLPADGYGMSNIDSARQSDIVERLLAMYSHRGDGIPTQYVNPDGPKAATEITALRERVAKLEGALRQIVDRPKGKPASGLAVVSELCLIANLALSDSPPATDGV